MNRAAAVLRRRGMRMPVAVLMVLAMAATPRVGGATPSGRASPVRAGRGRTDVSRVSRTVSVAVGSMGGDARARGMLGSALSAWILQQPGLRLHDPSMSSDPATLVLSANVRALVVQRDAAGVLARCDLGVVVADGQGAVRGMLDARRTIRSATDTTDDALAQAAVRGAVEGAMRNLVAQMIQPAILSMR